MTPAPVREAFEVIERTYVAFLDELAGRLAERFPDRQIRVRRWVPPPQFEDDPTTLTFIAKVGVYTLRHYVTAECLLYANAPIAEAMTQLLAHELQEGHDG